MKVELFVTNDIEFLCLKSNLSYPVMIDNYLEFIHIPLKL